MFCLPQTKLICFAALIIITSTCKSKDSSVDERAQALALGTFTVVDHAAVLIIAAPHGGFDVNTESLADALCQNDKWSCLIANGFRTDDHPINVNRPTEGVGEASVDEDHTDRARYVYDEYQNQVSTLTHDLKLYVEVHGNSREQSKGYIEVATTGIDSDQASIIKQLLNDSLVGSGIEGVTVLVEPVDNIYFSASASKKWGSLSVHSPSLHMEFPSELRRAKLDLAKEFLTKSLPEVVSAVFP